jgi:hypothetical protein
MVEPLSVEYPTVFAVMLLVTSVLELMEVLVVSVETERALALSVEALMLLTDIALVHVSALLAPLVRTIPVGTGVKRPLMVILLHKILWCEVKCPQGYTDLHEDSCISHDLRWELCVS